VIYNYGKWNSSISCDPV